MIVDLDGPGCPVNFTSRPLPTCSTPTTEVNSLNTIAIVGGLMAGLVGLVVLALTSVVTMAIISRRSKHSTGGSE